MKTVFSRRVIAPLMSTVVAGLMSLPVFADDAKVYFIEPMDGATVTSPVTVKFGLKGMGVAPAGVQVEHTGHHHLLVDVDTLPDLTLPLPKSEHVMHFGAGQTETTVDLPAGTHTLQLVLGNYAHVPVGEALVSDKITITVK